MMRSAKGYKRIAVFFKKGNAETEATMKQVKSSTFSKKVLHGEWPQGKDSKKKNCMALPAL